ncbi:hypothetical protein D5R81_00845 [Parashewanella spongiae]|uniref:Spondin domain-containing protein n=1 Tax=Parashewanella spongiae TaxID=342950 RepID=A0A3A6UCL7_9GAMM|nr:spondin domain-containing protein [Parashewanella spongiae]MCL1078692.1 spondin domain-containing protein [Parashewanella spongiae]RJY19399.1 hypothetical protein D5R81_00845 [Parashewanella spongiae]
MKLSNLCKSIALTGLIALPVTAADLEVKVINLTHGNHFTPVLAAAHDSELHLFQAGTKASEALQKMAEGGAVGDLDTLATAAGAVVVANPFEGLLAPSTASAKFELDSGEMTHLSLVAMILPTNDAFIGLDAWKIPTEAGTYTINLNAYDAGTEANNELVVEGSGALGVLGIPVAPGGDAGTGGTGLTDDSTNENVHIHPGVLGDTDLSGGKSDLDSRNHRWLNPVARVVVTVK